MTAKRILFIQHAGALGGSAVSLRSLANALISQGFEPIIACIHPSQAVLDYYIHAGIKIIYWPGIYDFMHSTGGWYRLYNPLEIFQLLRRIINFRSSIQATEALIKYINPDIVHLNSLVLPSCAIAVKRSNKKLVWHIRESIVSGHFGVRKSWLAHLVKTLPDEAIFISSDGRRLLVGNQKGITIPNFIDFKQFDCSVSGKHVRTELGLSSQDLVILFLGGRSVIKGIFPLLNALVLVKRQLPSVHLIMPSGAYHFSGRIMSRIARAILPMVGSGTVAQRVDKLIEKNKMDGYVHMLEWRDDIPALMAASDVIVFPSTAPHFARPIIEAGAMAKPVIGSRIGGVEELIEDRKTGILVMPNNIRDLADALLRVLQDPQSAQEMGKYGLEQAHSRFSSEANIRLTEAVYENLKNEMK